MQNHDDVISDRPPTPTHSVFQNPSSIVQFDLPAGGGRSGGDVGPDRVEGGGHGDSGSGGWGILSLVLIPVIILVFMHHSGVLLPNLSFQIVASLPQKLNINVVVLEVIFMTTTSAELLVHSLQLMKLCASGWP